MNEQEILAIVRTLLALERNYLSRERTWLAQLRTGLTLSLIGPSATTVLTYATNFTPFNEPAYVEWIAYSFFVIVTVLGIWMAYHAYSKLKGIRKVLRETRIREREFAKNSATLFNLIKEIAAEE